MEGVVEVRGVAFEVSPGHKEYLDGCWCNKVTCLIRLFNVDLLAGHGGTIYNK